MLEKKMYKVIKKDVKAYGYSLRRIENSIEDGWPDTMGQGRNGSFMAELKQVKAPARGLKTDSRIKPRWEAGQIPWAAEHIKKGGVWFIIITIGDEFYMARAPKLAYKFSELKPYSAYLVDMYVRQTVIDNYKIGDGGTS